ncbi:MAG: S-layer homology domain-containing protein [Clostridia bacterium]|nr:S-layer homology domain-containing protein [Clostridia bacterium]
MSVKIRIVLCIIICFSMIVPSSVSARMGDSGYEGGISSGEAPNKALFDYQEVCFISGEPIVLKGTVLIKKSLKQDNKSTAKQEVLTTTYTYNLKNTDKAATLTRVMILSTKLLKKENGQTVEETSLARIPSETIKIKNATYTLKNYDFSRTNLIDPKPAINYYAGNLWGRKTYQMGTGTASGSGKVIVEETGEFYGYDQYWGTTEAQIIDYTILNEQKKGDINDVWGGTASIKLSSTTTKEVEFVESIPNQISFKGGYIQKQHNEGIMEYSCKLPEFDQNGVSTDTMIDTDNSLKIESFPVQTRLGIPNVNHLRGHWAENYVKLLYSLEVFRGNDSTFKPEQYISRAEFAAAITEAAKEVPVDPAMVSKTAKKTDKNKKIESPFNDVSVDNLYFNQIDSAYKRGLMGGVGNNNFSPNGYLTVSDAVTILIRALGLESMAPNPEPVTTFKDNDKIPSHAKKAIYVAEKIGLVEADTRGYLNPSQKLTKAKVSIMFTKFIEYMQNGIKKDYRERIVNY